MNRRHFFALVSLTSVLAVGSLQACSSDSGDDTIPEPDSGTRDASRTDSSSPARDSGRTTPPNPALDATAPIGDADAGDLDASGMDSGDVDAGDLDAGDLDAGNDASDLDAGETDSGNLDAGNDAGNDAGGDPDAGDAGMTPATFPETLANAICKALTRCCFGNNADLDASVMVDGGTSGTFDATQCHNLYTDLGFESSNVGYTAAGAKVEIDPDKSADCLAKVDQLACNLDGASFKTIRAACYGAIRGKVVPGGACNSSIECTDGNFCLPTLNSGAGTCQPLRGSGGACGIINTGDPETDSVPSEVACSQRGGGSTSLRCDSYDFDPAVDDYRPRSEWTCKPTVANGEHCNSSVWCSDGLCDPGENADQYVCVGMKEYFNRFSCQSFVH